MSLILVALTTKAFASVYLDLRLRGERKRINKLNEISK